MKKPTDAPEGMRLCKKCAEFLSMDQFYASQNTLYECKTHIREKSAQSRLKVQSNPCDKIVLGVWDRFRADGRKIFQQHSFRVSTRNIRDLFLSKGITPTDEWRVVPIYPDETWEMGNMDIVSKKTRRILVTTISKNGRDEDQRYVKTYAALIS
jgi:hypothetical protein